MKLSKLSIKCLSNMPMLTEAMAKTLNELYDILSPYYDEYCDLLNRKIVSDKRGGFRLNKGNAGSISTFNESLPLEKSMSIDFEISSFQDKKKNSLGFRIVFGYLCDEEQNSIYFQLFEESDSVGVITESFASDLISSIPNEWKTGIHENSLYVEFAVDENLSKNKINECGDIFKQYILLPFIAKLKQ